ncbi:hypothetical protein [Kaistia nematophila]|uniref:Uncharacterized protein n=1 Tax=Kaistia nematophila TaxID=2994654 RepID=A0A9X3E771_9HYPH|nr:hypothetical protein [Kaistia nematophila]MCX5570823.1 hypothetical protein [Kaistia nematophila]
MCEIVGIPSFAFAIASILAGLFAGLIALIENWAGRIIAMRLRSIERDRKTMLDASRKPGLAKPSPLISSSEIVAADFRDWNRGRRSALRLQAAILGKFHDKSRSIIGLTPRKISSDDGLLQTALIERSFAEMTQSVKQEALDNSIAKRRSKVLVAALLCLAAVFGILAALPC